MPRCNIYLDESGDLGFKFGAPYRQGGSSRHLTLGAVVCDDDANKHLKRFIRKFYEARKIPAGAELKWADLDPAARLDFARRAASLATAKRAIHYYCITVYKPNVMPHIQADPNKLYNYMTGLMLLPVMRRYAEVNFIPDARSIQVESGNSLHDYLQTKLWFDETVATKLNTMPLDSARARPLHFTDYLCGTFQSYHEDGAADAKNALINQVTCQKLFFPPTP